MNKVSVGTLCCFVICCCNQVWLSWFTYVSLFLASFFLYFDICTVYQLPSLFVKSYNKQHVAFLAFSLQEILSCIHYYHQLTIQLDYILLSTYYSARLYTYLEKLTLSWKGGTKVFTYYTLLVFYCIVCALIYCNVWIMLFKLCNSLYGHIICLIMFLHFDNYVKLTSMN